MKAVRINRFGPPEVVVIEDVPTPAPGPGEVLVRVSAAGVAPWDALIREGKSKVSPRPPLTLGSDLAGVVEAVGPGVANFHAGDEVYGLTNPQFCGAQAEYAVASAAMVAAKPAALDFLEAASAPVIAVTAWQMLFEYANSKRGDTVIVTGAAGNVGAYLVQLAQDSDIQVIAVARPSGHELLRKLGVTAIFDPNAPGFVERLPQVDAILDTVGDATLERCLGALKHGGKLVTAVPAATTPQDKVQPITFYAEVTTARLHLLTPLFESGRITTRVGSVLPLAEARAAHEMLAGAPHKPGKIVLRIE